jgi:hypothetical protein
MSDAFVGILLITTRQYFMLYCTEIYLLCIIIIIII